MKRLFPFLIIAILIASCKSSSKQLEQGDYDSALQKSAKKIKKNPSKFEEVDTFNDAYRLANKRDEASVLRLKQKGDPANWVKIHQTYLKMDARQNLAISLPPVGIQFNEINYTPEINNAKLKATEYLYAKGEQLLASQDRFDARKAHGKFLAVKKYDKNYKDLNNKLAEATFKGTTNVYFEIKDNSGVVAPRGLIEEVQRINIRELNETWKNYDTRIDTHKTYHYSIILNMTLIDVSPEELKERVFSESKKVENGFDYVLDANGNVTKDTLGNDVKIIKYKTIRCSVQEVQQHKVARISGTIDYIDNFGKKLLKSEPIASDAIFEHYSAMANGDINALPPEIRQTLGTEPIPFPSDEALILQAGDVLKTMTKDIIVSNKNFLK